MPVIKRTAPLLPEGEYCGQARKVSLEWSKPKLLPNGGKSESVQMFKIPLHLPDGKSITTFLRVTEDMGWKFESLLKSGELIPPDDEEYALTPDDIEGRRFYFGVKHEPWNGTTVANVRFHTKPYACQINPALEGISFPNEAPRGVALRAAKPQAPSNEPPPEASGVAATKSPEPPQSHATGSDPLAGLGTLSDEEFEDALRNARKLREEKKD
jgi:hypothetical protein